MKIEQIYTGCLAEAAYYIESAGEAAIIDPLREVQPYLGRAERDGARIKYVLETHFHADFVSGHLDLAHKSGATIVYGPTAAPDFPCHIATDGEELSIGKIKIRVLHTPGHTMESTTYLLLDEQGKEYCIFSGDTLFIGDVGRPDLAQKAASMTQEELAGLLYDSLQNKIIPLPDEVIVYPGHGAGSACGKNMSKETYDTLGNQKKINYALKATSKEQFIKEVTDGLLPPPYYFPQNVMLNKKGYASFDEVMEKGHRALTPEQAEMVVEAEQALVLDTRQITEFGSAHVPGSVFIGIDGDFAPWVGTLITDIRQPIVLVTEPGREDEVITRLARVGYENIVGYLEGGIEAWLAAGKEADHVQEIMTNELEALCKIEQPYIVDVRKQSEYEAERLENAHNIPLASLNENMAGFSKEQDNYIHCAGGYRSMIACSILKARGFHNIVNIDGGFAALKESCLPKTSYICPSTLIKK